jgi:hypothetical protein
MKKSPPKCSSLDESNVCELHNIYPDRFPQSCHGPMKCFGKKWKTHLENIQPSGEVSGWMLANERMEELNIEIEDVEDVEIVVIDI